MADRNATFTAATEAAKSEARKQAAAWIDEASEVAVARVVSRLGKTQSDRIRELMRSGDEARVKFALAEDQVARAQAGDEVEDWEAALEMALETERLIERDADRAAALVALKAAGRGAMVVARKAAVVALKAAIAGVLA